MLYVFLQQDELTTVLGQYADVGMNFVSGAPLNDRNRVEVLIDDQGLYRETQVRRTHKEIDRHHENMINDRQARNTLSQINAVGTQNARRIASFSHQASRHEHTLCTQKSCVGVGLPPTIDSKNPTFER